MIYSWDINTNFWELYPELKILFSKLYKSDKSRGKDNSSKTMWFISLFTDSNSKYINVPEEERIELLCEEYMNDSKFYVNRKELLDELIELYRLSFESPMQRHLRQWNNSLNDRTKFLATMKYSLDNFEELDKMAANTPKIYKAISDLRAELEKEEGDGNLKGGAKESLSD